MEQWYFPLLAVTGVAVGFLNVTAGGGSLISMPILIFLGLEPAMANGTNRVAILIQNITAVSSFRSHGYSEMQRSLGLALCTVPGAIAGAFAACVIIVALFISTVSADRFLEVIPAGTEAVAVSASGGQPRDVDVQRVRTLIREKKLSDKEAEFYKQIE